MTCNAVRYSGQTMRRLILTLTVGLVLAAPAQAQDPASQQPSGYLSMETSLLNESLVQNGLAAARAHWGVTPDCAGVNVWLAQLDWLNPNFAGVASGCDIWIDTDYWATAPPAAYFCAVMVHEFGHLLDHEHTDNPADVMFGMPAIAPTCAAAAPVPAAEGDDLSPSAVRLERLRDLASTLTRRIVLRRATLRRTSAARTVRRANLRARISQLRLRREYVRGQIAELHRAP
jgi:hypothetical protein